MRWRQDTETWTAAAAAVAVLPGRPSVRPGLQPLTAHLLPAARTDLEMPGLPLNSCRPGRSKAPRRSQVQPVRCSRTQAVDTGQRRVSCPARSNRVRELCLVDHSKLGKFICGCGAAASRCKRCTGLWRASAKTGMALKFQPVPSKLPRPSAALFGGM